MDPVIILESSFTLDVTIPVFEQWLQSYYMRQHPDHEPSVWHTFYGGVAHVSYHAPPNGRITFECTVSELERLKVVKIVGYPGWDEYFRELVESLKQRWGSRTLPHGFNLVVKNEVLAKNLGSRWIESEQAFLAGAYLATIVLLGSILEGLLLAKVQQNQMQANQAKSAPKEERGKVRPLNKWMLGNLIDVAYECGWISKPIKDHSKHIQAYRNLIHPREQVKLNFYPNKETCEIAKRVVSAVLSDLAQG